MILPWSVPSLKETLMDLAYDEEAEAQALEHAAQREPLRAQHLRSFAAKRRRIAEHARDLAKGLY